MDDDQFSIRDTSANRFPICVCVFMCVSSRGWVWAVPSLPLVPCRVASAHRLPGPVSVALTGHSLTHAVAGALASDIACFA